MDLLTARVRQKVYMSFDIDINGVTSYRVDKKTFFWHFSIIKTSYNMNFFTVKITDKVLYYL